MSVISGISEELLETGLYAKPSVTTERMKFVYILLLWLV